MSETSDHARFSEDGLKILTSFELSNIHSMVPIQADQQIRGDKSRLHPHYVRETLKVLQEVSAFARRQAKDVYEMKQFLLHGNLGSPLVGDMIHQNDLVQLLLRGLEKRRLCL